jgi:hypothetical protein
MLIMELSSITRLVVKKTLVHETLARAPKYIKKIKQKKPRRKSNTEPGNFLKNKTKPNMDKRTKGEK